MDLLILIFLFVFGAIIGSFINVIGLRYNTGLKVANDRSRCFHCNIPLKWYDLFPLLSYFLLGGKCRLCKGKISPQYPIVEFLTGILFIGIYLRQLDVWPLFSSMSNGVSILFLFFFYYLFVFSLLMVIAIYDLRHKVIPNPLVYTFIGLGIVKLIFFLYFKQFTLTSFDWLDLLAPFALFVPFALLWFISKGTWIGFGDAKLAFGIGALLGFVSGVNAIILSFWIGAIFSIWLLIVNSGKKKGRLGMKSEVPFAPFLILGTIIIFLTRLDLIGLQEFLSFFYPNV